MGSAALKASRAVSHLLRARRLELNMTLREVSERLEQRGERFPTSTLTRVEHGKLDPGVRRLHLLMGLYKISPHLVADLVELEEHAVEEPTETDVETLYREGIEHLKRGNTGQALAHVFALRSLETNDPASRARRQEATLALASVARDLGKFHLARDLVEKVLCDPPSDTVMVRALVLASSLWYGNGSAEIAIALIRQAASRVAEDDSRTLVWVLHQEAKFLFSSGDLDEAEARLKQVLSLYRKLEDRDGESRALILKLQLLEARGQIDAAIDCARKVIEAANKGGHAMAQASGHLELGRLLIRSGSVDEGMEHLNQALSQALLLRNKLIEFHAHYNLWKAYRVIGDPDRERFEFQAAAYFVRFIDASSGEAREIRDAADRQQPRSGRRRRRRRGPVNRS